MERYDVVLLSSFGQVEAWLKDKADKNGQGVFSQTATTFDAWIADWWELAGDGRAIVSPLQRQVIMSGLFEQEAVELKARGFAVLAAQCARDAAGVPAFEAAVESVRETGSFDGLSSRECELLGLLSRYGEVLSSHGLVEFGEAAQLIAQCGEACFAGGLRVLWADAKPLDWIQQSFFEECDLVELNCEAAVPASQERVNNVPANVSASFSLPAGKLAQPASVVDFICGLAGAESVVVACKDPIGMHFACRERLAELGWDACVQASKPFSQTDFGKAFLAHVLCSSTQTFPIVALSDAIANPFSGVPPIEARRADEALRKDRLADPDSICARYSAEYEPFSYLQELATDPEADILLGFFEDMAQSAARPPAWKTEQLSAISTLRECMGAARMVGSSVDDCLAALEAASVSTAQETLGEGPKAVFTSQSIASQMAPGSCEALVIADLTTADYPVADKEDAQSTLMEKIGIVPAESALHRARREFNALLATATTHVHLVRPAHDENAGETYPSVVLEEFLEACRSATPEPRPRGEELLYANALAVPRDGTQRIAATVPALDLSHVGADAALEVVAKRWDSTGEPISDVCLSPSQIEAYLECPYRWFVSRRLHAQDLEEGFGFLEMGTFAHEALERFYRRFQEGGHLKVNEANLDEARTVMHDVLDELVAAQADEEPGSGRLVAVTELERREVDELCDRLVGFLDFEAAFLPTFHPAYFEYEITVDAPASYGGHLLVGKVDRIDVDDAGHAVIVDYKGSAGDAYQIAGKSERDMGKVQTRIYAQAVKRALGLNVVGALYVSYGRKHALAGAYDPRVIEAAHLPFAKKGKNLCALSAKSPADGGAPDDGAEAPDGERMFADMTFDEMLDETERIVAKAIDSMIAGDVEPRVANASTCTFCPVAACPKRGA